VRVLPRCSSSAVQSAVVVALAATACTSDPVEPVASADQIRTAAAIAPPALVQVSGGASHTCGLTSTGEAWCWGFGDNGQLGTGDGALRPVPTRVAGGLRFRQISAGGFYICGVTTENRLWCWGANFNGGLGDGTTERRFLPVPVSTSLRFLTVSDGLHSGHTCGLTTERAAYCWGANGDGELGDGSRTRRLLPVAVAGGRTWRQISAGASHSCGVTQGRVALCWGSDDQGQLGDNPERQRRVVPRQVAGGLAFDQISTGFFRTCGVITDARAFCWGEGGVGQIGDGKRLDRYVPRAVAGGQRFRRISAVGINHTCAEAASGRVYCWGGNFWGEVGDGTTEPRLRPVTVATSLVFAQMATGTDHTCAVTADAATYCWGANEFGQLGDGTTRNSRSTPGPVIGGS
jgi:alpha-tubulin suppressor-like RCC1 family protein